MIIVCQKPLKRLKINGIALFPFIFIRRLEDRENKILINHEKIHLRQQLELLVIFFYFFYIIEYYYWLLKLKNRDLAYRRISFEREAYTNEYDLDYLKNRKFWSFRKYL
ncbi:membrane protein [Chryseobacterium taiwanense]|uniref:Membrane protein n=1 Tax=Chryseobacterium taiwanense TaxID=363331 RepID=A0A0B4EA90_9FLAO|nr:membrane protein [Chryseobacterium taiwanense]KIC63548.1 membrane protein [Chryseobacterium taiwanense]